jgi:hypothetical protein
MQLSGVAVPEDPVRACLGPTERIRRYALEVLRLDRADAPDLPSYLASVIPQTEAGSPMAIARRSLQAWRSQT